MIISLRNKFLIQFLILNTISQIQSAAHIVANQDDFVDNMLSRITGLKHEALGVSAFLEYSDELNDFILGNSDNISNKSGINNLFFELIYAAKNGNKKKIESLIKQGIKVNNKYGEVALIEAIRFKHLEVVELLISSGVNVNAVDIDGSTALIRTALIANEKIVQLLIRANADINAANKNGNTALMQAVRSKNKEVIRLLLLSGADLDHKSNDGNKAANYIRVVDQDTQTIATMLTTEPARREEALKKWLETNRGNNSKNIAQISKEITASTNGILIDDLAELIATYNINYLDIPIDDRLGYKKTAEKKDTQSKCVIC